MVSALASSPFLAHTRDKKGPVLPTLSHMGTIHSLKSRGTPEGSR
jgi:hypothetical protein